MAILTITDFETGRYYIPMNESQEVNEIPQYIDRVEKEFLTKLFGKGLYDLFIADYAILTTAPTAARFVTIFNAFVEQDENAMLVSDGIKDMLKGFDMKNIEGLSKMVKSLGHGMGGSK